LVSLRLSVGLVAVDAVFYGSGECNPIPIGLRVVMPKFDVLCVLSNLARA